MTLPPGDLSQQLRIDGETYSFIVTSRKPERLEFLACRGEGEDAITGSVKPDGTAIVHTNVGPDEVVRAPIGVWQVLAAGLPQSLLLFTPAPEGDASD